MSANPLLSFEWVTGPHSDQTNVVVMLHGILGQKRNLMSFARGFVSAFPQYRIMLVDLRNHGASQGFNGPHTLDACAMDLHQLFRDQNVNPRSIIGHSFGAGVTAIFASRFGEAVKSIWLLDAVPALDPLQRGTTVDAQTAQVLSALESLEAFDSKAGFTEALRAKGLSSGIISWLAMNLQATSHDLEFRPRPSDAREMIDDLRRTYSLSLVRKIAEELPVFMVQADGNPRWNAELVEKIKSLSREVNVHLLCLPHSGHWVHIDNPKGVLDLMVQDFA